MNRSAGQEPPPLADTLRQLLSRLLANGQTRLELAKLEAAAEAARLGRTAALAAAALLCGFLAVEMLAALVIAAYWNTPWRLRAIGALLCGAAAACAVLILVLRARRGRPSTLFDATRAELEKDRRALERP
ncbi:MAG: phage holin family protein [Nevskia sp.]|nr:phage holin family protein [Nevskia sp.]